MTLNNSCRRNETKTFTNLLEDFWLGQLSGGAVKRTRALYACALDHVNQILYYNFVTSLRLIDHNNQEKVPWCGREY